MKRAFPPFLTLAALLCFASGCIRYEPELTEKDREKIVYMMKNSSYSAEQIDVYLVYDKKDVPRYLIGVTRKGYYMFKRSDYSIIEGADGKTPYDGYLDCKKYYSMFLCYCVYDESVPEAPYYSPLDDFRSPDISEALRAGKGS